MIKFLFKFLLAVILLIMIIPLFRLLIWIVTHVFADVLLVSIDPMGVATLLIIGVAILLIILAIKA